MKKTNFYFVLFFAFTLYFQYSSLWFVISIANEYIPETIKVIIKVNNDRASIVSSVLEYIFFMVI